MREPNVVIMEAISTLLDALPEQSLRYIRSDTDRRLRDLDEERTHSENSIIILPFGRTQGLIPVIKRLRELTGMGLVEARDLIVNGGVVQITGSKDRNDFIEMLKNR